MRLSTNSADRTVAQRDENCRAGPAIAGLADAGWRIAVRADFDPAGMGHVRMLLAACPTAVPWRVGEAAPQGRDGRAQTENPR